MELTPVYDLLREADKHLGQAESHASLQNQQLVEDEIIKIRTQVEKLMLLIQGVNPTTNPNADEDAAFIVNAWNCHDKLVAALEDGLLVAKLYQKFGMNSEAITGFISKASKALANATEAP